MPVQNLIHNDYTAASGINTSDLAYVDVLLLGTSYSFSASHSYADLDEAANKVGDARALEWGLNGTRLTFAPLREFNEATLAGVSTNGAIKHMVFVAELVNGTKVPLSCHTLPTATSLLDEPLTLYCRNEIIDFA